MTAARMSSMHALRMFRSCTASLSSRTLAQSAVLRLPSRPLPGRRYYSEQTIVEETGESKGREDVVTKEEPLSPELEKLKAKEAEVVDLTVCVSVFKRLTFYSDAVTQARLRYLQADFLNLQRNAAREKEQTRDFAITRFASDLLEIVDVLSLALKSVPQSLVSSSESPGSSTSTSLETPPPTAESSPSPAAKTPEAYLRELYTGVEMTQRLLVQTLFKYYVKPFDPTGDRFDPNRHEALYQAPIPGKEPGTVIDCQKLGYTIKDRVLRAAQVGVAQEAQP